MYISVYYITVYIIDVNDDEHFNAEPRLSVIDAEPRFLFSEKKTSPSRDYSQTSPSCVETLGN